MISPANGAHSALAYLADWPGMGFFQLEDGGHAYAAAALREHGDCLELHLELLHYGPRTVRALRRDLEDLKALAGSMGKTRIVGLRTEATMRPDPRWAKFTRLFGFTGQRLFQAAELHLG